MKLNDVHQIYYSILDLIKNCAISPYQIKVQKTSPSQHQITANKDLETNKR